MRCRSTLQAITLAALATTVAMAPAALAEQVAQTSDTLAVPNPWQAPVNCANHGECPGLDGVSYTDLDVSDALADAGSTARYNLHALDPARYLLETWQVCFYDADVARLGCNSHSGDWLYIGSIPDGTELVRVILREGAGAEFQLRVFV